MNENPIIVDTPACEQGRLWAELANCATIAPWHRPDWHRDQAAAWRDCNAANAWARRQAADVCGWKGQDVDDFAVTFAQFVKDTPAIRPLAA